MKKHAVDEGYHIFSAIGHEERGYEGVAAELQQQIKKAESEFDMVFLSGPSFKDDPGGRCIYFASQAAILTRKK